VPTGVYVEVDDPTDDIECTFDGARALIQAKRTADLRILKDILTEQWIPAVLAADWTDDTALVLAVAEPSRSLRTLGDAWRRWQDPNAGAPSAPERKQLRWWDSAVADAVSNMSQHLATVTARRLSQAVVLAQIAGGGSGSASWQMSLARLAGQVVPRKQAESAMNALGQAVRSMAVLRSGGTTRDWAGQLGRTHGVDLIARADGATSARIAAENQALAAYRARLARQLNRLALHPYGIPLPAVVVPGLAGTIYVSTEGSDHSSGVDLLDEVRGCSRMLLVGPAGAGKSEALRQLAAFAADPLAARRGDVELEDEWRDLRSWAPLPILVPLTRLLPSAVEPDRPIVLTLSRMAAAAAEHLSGNRSELAAQLIEQEIRSSPTLLLLDGLDECRSRIPEMVACLKDFFQTLPSECTVVLSSRPHAVVDTKALGLQVFHLQPAAKLDQAIRAILTALAECRSSQQQDTWLEQREAWLRWQASNHRELFDLPLMSLLGAVVAGTTRELANLPDGRATLVEAVLNRFVEAWEARRHPDGLIGAQLDHSSAIEAMTETFLVIAHALNPTSSADEATVRRAITRQLNDRYLPALGLAESAAKRLLWTWIESGILQRSDDGVISPRLRLVGEVGEALHATARPEQLNRWLVDRIDSSDRHEEVLLAAELSPRVADLVLDLLESTPAQSSAFIDRALLCRDVLDITRSHHDVAKLRRRLAAAVHSGAALDDLEQPHEPSAAVTSGDRAEGAAGDDWRTWVLWMLIEIYIQNAPRDALVTNGVALTLRLPRRLAAVAHASLWTIAIYGGDIHDDVDLAAFAATKSTMSDQALAAWSTMLNDGLTDPPTDPRLTGFDAWLGARRHSRTLITAAAVMLPRQPELAPTLARLSQHIGRRDSEQLQRILTRHGHDHLLKDFQKQEARRSAELLHSINDNDDEVWLERLEQLAPPAQLTRWQQWRLPALGALERLYDLGQLAGNEHAIVLHQAAEAHARLDKVAITLLGLDPAAVAAEAKQLLGARPTGRRRWSPMLTLYRAATPGHLDWGRSGDLKADRSILLEVLSFGRRMLAMAALTMLYDHPRRAETARLLETQLPELTAETQFTVASYTAAMGGDETISRLAVSEQPLTRAGAGRVVAITHKQNPDISHLEPFVNDIDRSVRALTLEALAEPLNDDKYARLDTWLAVGPRQATCIHCGYANTAAVSECSQCSLDLPTIPTRKTASPITRARRRRRRRRLTQHEHPGLPQHSAT
jgi:hypothetical protein